MSTWTFNEPPTHLTWTTVEILLTTYTPLLIHVVFECPLKQIHSWKFIFFCTYFWFLNISYLVQLVFIYLSINLVLPTVVICLLMVGKTLSLFPCLPWRFRPTEMSKVRWSIWLNMKICSWLQYLAISIRS